MFAAQTKLEILDLRHFSSPALRPLLEEQAAKWERRLHWNYLRSIELLLEYVDNRSLTGYVAPQRGRVAGYAFGVCEAAKAVLGDVYAFGEGEQRANPVCDQLLTHLVETLQATPGVDRIESQLLLFPEDALRGPFRESGFRAYPRCFMTCDLDGSPALPPSTIPRGLRLERWQPELYLPAAALIHAAYLGHTDSEINDQYRSLFGAQRFLHNIVNFPGCGVFAAADSAVLRDERTGALVGMVLCSRVREDTAHITQLCVRPGVRGRGLGKLLLSHCLAHLARKGTRGVSLTVTEDNLGARRLYAQHGFHVLQRFEAWVWEKRRW